jgi:hypothetical protein
MRSLWNDDSTPNYLLAEQAVVAGDMRLSVHLAETPPLERGFGHRVDSHHTLSGPWGVIPDLCMGDMAQHPERLCGCCGAPARAYPVQWGPAEEAHWLRVASERIAELRCARWLTGSGGMTVVRIQPDAPGDPAQRGHGRAQGALA